MHRLNLKQTSNLCSKDSGKINVKVAFLIFVFITGSSSQGQFPGWWWRIMTIFSRCCQILVTSWLLRRSVIFICIVAWMVGISRVTWWVFTLVVLRLVVSPSIFLGINPRWTNVWISVKVKFKSWLITKLLKNISSY